MAAYLKKLEFRQRYPSVQQGLFILLAEKRIPKDQPVVNLGQVLSTKLCSIQLADRLSSIARILSEILVDYPAVTLTHIELLFTPSFELDVIRTLLAQCRNRKICIVWRGAIIDGKLYYATPEHPEFYECDTNPLQDTYIVTE